MAVDSIHLKETKDTSWPENVQMFPMLASSGGSISILYTRSSCFASKRSSLGHAHVGSLFTIEDQEQVCDVFDFSHTFQPCS